MYARRLDVRAIFGVTVAVLGGLQAKGMDPAQLFAGRIIWATSGAHARLAPSEGMILRMWSELGPAFGAECIHGGGVHVSSEEWSCEIEEGALVLSSRLPRLVEFSRHRTGVRARIPADICPCGGRSGSASTS